MQKATWSTNDVDAVIKQHSMSVLEGTGNSCENMAPGTPYVANDGYLASLDSLTKSGEVVSNYWELVEAGALLPVTNYHVSQKEAQGSPSTFAGECYRPFWPTTQKSSGDAVGIASLNILSELDPHDDRLDMLLQRAVADGLSQGWDVLTELAESPETVKMFYRYIKAFRNRKLHVAKLVRKGLKHPKTGRLTAWKKLSGKERLTIFENQFLNRWMEVRYGWRPLVYSSEAVVETLRNVFDTSDRVVRTRAREDSSESSSIPSITVATSRSTGAGSIEYLATHEKRVEQRGFFIGLIKQRNVKEMSFTLNPVGTAWEIVPYSFVVDWALNINELAQAHWPVSYYAQRVMGVSTKITETCVVDFWSHGDDYTGSHYGGKLSVSETSYTREPRGQVPWDLSLRSRVTLPKMVDLTAILKNFAKI